MPLSFWCEQAWLGTGVGNGVLIECADGLITSVTADVPAPADAHRLSGVVFPGFANAHSHAFHRALRGRTHADGGTFWTWRRAMYRLAERLDPDGYHSLARLVFGEMVRAGFTCVGEFHYLHHAPGGRPYADPNAMGHALVAAADDAGIRLALLDTCYLAGGLTEDGYQPLTGPQLRFGDGDVTGWLSRVDSFGGRTGLALHSVRAVPADQLRGFDPGDRPVHVHLSEQPAENEACQAYHGCSPTELLSAHGVLGPATTAVHATHLSTTDIFALGSSGTTACFCPTTEADLADGIGPATELAAAGSPLALGTDQHAVVDPFAEVRGLEYGARVRSGRRGRFTPAELVTAATEAGYRALGWAGGRIEAGRVADLVAVRPTGAAPDQAVLAAGAADVATVVVGGRVVVSDGWHETMGTVGPELARAIGELWA